MRVLDASAITRLARWNHCMYGASRIRGLSLVISMVRLFPLLHYSGERVAATEPGCRGGTADRKREKKRKKKEKKKKTRRMKGETQRFWTSSEAPTPPEREDKARIVAKTYVLGS